MSCLDNLREDMIREIKNDRWAWRFTILPQLIMIGILKIALSIFVGYALYMSVQAFRDIDSGLSVVKIAQILIRGSSSLLGFIVIRLIPKLWDSATNYVNGERRFTKYIGKTKLVKSRNELTSVLDGYGRM